MGDAAVAVGECVSDAELAESFVSVGIGEDG